MKLHFQRALTVSAVACITAAGFSAAAGSAAASPPPHSAAAGVGQLAPAQPGPLVNCASLSGFEFENTQITAATLVPAGTLSNAGAPVGEHCLVTGKMNERVSPVDGQTYAIGFEMRLPTDWSGRFLHQGNGGADGRVVEAQGNVTGGQLRSGLQMGFAVLSSDAGHTLAQALFGLDPQARLDYGYQAVGSLTPMAKELISAAYGRGPDRSYFAGTSNGGRHTMVAAARYADEYDGFLASAPGFNLPKAAVAQLWGAQQYASAATDVTNLETAFPMPQRQLVASAVLASCDGLDGLEDGMVQDAEGCKKAFVLDQAVPTCAGAPDATCLTADQKQAVQNVFAGARNSAGDALYSPFYFDPGLATTGWADWEFVNSVGTTRDPLAVGFIFSVPPEDPAMLDNTLGYALGYDVDTQYGKIFATNDVYTESAMSFMTPPDPTDLDVMRERGGKMIVTHGTSDAAFSAVDTARWYEDLDRAYRGKADEFVRYFEIPGMGHSRGGPATDQYDGLGAIIEWVEGGEAPDRIVASARGAGNAGGVNPDVPADWAPDRTRPLCPFPLVATYTGGDVEDASSFDCTAVNGRGHSALGGDNSSDRVPGHANAGHRGRN